MRFSRAIIDRRQIWEQEKSVLYGALEMTMQNCVDAYLYRDYMRNNYMFVVDILKLLTGAEDYLRE